jgi:hypothetical protein
MDWGNSWMDLDQERAMERTTCLVEEIKWHPQWTHNNNHWKNWTERHSARPFVNCKTSVWFQFCRVGWAGRIWVG